MSKTAPTAATSLWPTLVVWPSTPPVLAALVSLSVSLSVGWSVGVCVCVSVCLLVSLYLLASLFADFNVYVAISLPSSGVPRTQKLRSPSAEHPR